MIWCCRSRARTRWLLGGFGDGGWRATPGDEVGPAVGFLELGAAAVEEVAIGSSLEKAE